MDVFKIFSSIAPTLHRAVTGNIGGAVQEALKAFGISDGSKDNLITALKTATPEQLAELKKIDADYQHRLVELNIDLERILLEDRKSARELYDKTGDKLVPLMAIGLLLGTFTLTAALLVVNIPTNNKDIVNIVLGVVIGYSSNVVTFYFGSSKSSSEKNAIMASMAKSKEN